MIHWNGAAALFVTIALLVLPPSRPAHALSYDVSGILFHPPSSSTFPLTGTFDFADPIHSQFAVRDVPLPNPVEASVSLEFLAPNNVVTPLTRLQFTDLQAYVLQLTWFNQTPTDFHAGPCSSRQDRSIRFWSLTSPLSEAVPPLRPGHTSLNPGTPRPRRLLQRPNPACCSSGPRPRPGPSSLPAGGLRRSSGASGDKFLRHRLAQAR
jgi:hypothetical protein